MTAVLPPEIKTDADLARPAKPRKERPEPEAPPEPKHKNFMGQMVRWRHPGGEWFPALVRYVNGDGTLRLTVFTNNPTPDTSKMCVCHISESNNVSEGRSHYGMWDYLEG